MSLNLDKLSESLKKSLENFDADAWYKKKEKKAKIYNDRVESIYFANKDNMPSFIEKVIEKYESDKYVNKELELGYEPREDLYWVLLKIASEHGSKANGKKYKKYLNMFTSEAYVYEGYFIQRMDGQGSVVRIDKIKK